MKTSSGVTVGACALAIAAWMTTGGRAGPLNPPAGPVSPTLKTLQEVEPRTAVQSLPGSTTASYVITQPGSYYLTGNIVRTPNKHGIQILADNVTIDLAGFSMLGNRPASGGGENAIDWAGGSRHGLVVRNGTLRDWPFYGLLGFGQEALLENLLVVNNFAGGLEAGSMHNSIVKDCRIVGNSEIGINLGSGGTVSGCVISGAFIGINAQDNTVISHCSIGVCSGQGITAGSAVITDCVIERITGDSSNGDGIRLNGAAVVKGCTVTGCSGIGIRLNGWATVQDNAVSSNGTGILARALGYPHNRIEGNNVSTNGVGIKIETAGNFVARNTASGNTTANYDIAAGNVVGAIQSSTTGAGPWDNFQF
jgi:parallel beta-helix repeat protein